MFTHLHNHTEYSFFDGCMKLESLFSKVKRNHMLAVAITDHHNVFAWFDAIQYAKKYQTNCIFGIELNVGKHHLTALAMNQTGIENLIVLNNLGYQKNGRPSVTEKQVYAHAAGIFFLSGCSKGKIPTLIAQGSYVEATALAKEYKERFSNNFALEIHHFNEKNYVKKATGIQHIAHQAQVGIVPTNDCHYLENGEFEMQNRLLTVQTNGKLHAVNNSNYFKTIDEMKLMFPEKLLNQTEHVRKYCRGDFESFIKEQKGDVVLPLAMVYRYGDAEALRKSFHARRQYRLGEYWHKKMKEKDLCLEDLYLPDSQEELQTAYSLRNRISLIIADPNYYIKTTEYMPIYRKSKADPFCAQLDYFTAKSFGFDIYDRRKERVEDENILNA